MASFIKIKRSTGTLAPASIQYGELAYTTGVGTHGNSGGKLFIGDNVPNSIAIGGRYYTDLLSIAPGLVAGQTNPTTAANGFVAVLDQNRKVDQWNVDNLTLDGNTLSSTNIDGDINIDPNGSGEIVVPDNTFLTFGTSKDTKIKYDEITDDRLEVTGADWNFANGVAISLSDVTESTSTTTGAFTVTGGVGIGARLNVAGNVDFDGDLNIDGGDVTTNSNTFNLIDGSATNVNFAGAATALVMGANTGIATVRNPTVVGTQATQNLYNTVTTTVNAFGAATQVNIGANTGTATVRNPTVVGTQATQNLYNTVATNLNFAGSATALVVGATTGIATIRNATLSVPNATALDLGAASSVVSVNFPSTLNTSFVSIAATTDAINTTTGALRVAGGVGIGARLNVAGNVDFDGDLNIDGGDVTSNTANLNLFNTTVTTANILGAGTNIVLGATTGVTTIRNAVVDLDGDLNIDGGDLTTNQTTFNLLTTNATIVNAFDTATSVNIGNTSDTSTVTVRSTQNTLSTSTGALVVSGGVGIASDLRVGGDVYIDGEIDITSDTTIVADLTVEGNTNLGNSSTDQVTIVGNVYHTGVSTNVGGIFVDAVGISSNIIQTRPGTGDKLYIDPYPDGLSNEGTVIIKGDLQVDGTTTTVNSITVTSNNPIYVVGDNATTRTVMTTVASGSVIAIDSVAGINTSDVVSGTNIPSNTIISSINSGTKEITLSNAIIGTIDAGTQLTITQGVDTNDDRGIAFKYISSGIGTEATVKTGFFGYTDSNSRWTYVPDAGIAGNVVTGTKGFLDIKGIYYQAGDFSTNGVNYFDSNGLMKSTVAPGAGINTSNYILTTDESGVPTWTDTIDGGMF
jgi:hypothetical protein